MNIYLSTVKHGRTIFLSVIIAIILVNYGFAQSASQYDTGTPPQLAAGVSSIGSYLSTDLGNINLANGSLNFHIPLATIGGRGLNTTISLNYSSKLWSNEFGSVVIPLDGTKNYTRAKYSSTGWTIGAAPFIRVRGVGLGYTNCNPGPAAPHKFQKMMVKLTLILPDKGEIQFRDDLTDGMPLHTQSDNGTGDCGSMKNDGYRGRRWHATDGSGAIYIADQDNGVSLGNLSGTVITADGTRYRFTDSWNSFFNSSQLKEIARCESITDRNGNQISISYQGDYLWGYNKVIFTDPLGRRTVLEFNVTDTDNSILFARVTIPGFQGATRYYKIKAGVMNENYRSGISPVLPVYVGDKHPDDTPLTSAPHTTLFGDSLHVKLDRIDDKGVLTELILPDNRSLRFAYNEYGEVAECIYPSGGKVQYDYAYAANLPTGNTKHNPRPRGHHSLIHEVDRAITTRRTLPDGVTTESTWTYTYNATDTIGNYPVKNGVTEVKAASHTGELLSWQKHYFLDAQMYGDSSKSTGYTLWSTGLERRVETLKANGAIFTAVEHDWSQRTPVNFTDWSVEQPENDNRINETRTYLENGTYSKVNITYDDTNNVRANNIIANRQYDFDGTLISSTNTNYIVDGIYNSDDYHLVRLPYQISLHDGNNNELSRTIYEYDSAAMQDYGSVIGHDNNYGVGRVVRGNNTSIKRWLNTDGSTLNVYNSYDILGNVIAIKDARNNVSTISYIDDYGDGSNPGFGSNGGYGPTYAFPTLATTPDLGNGVGSHSSRSQYDFSTGLLTGLKDLNGIISTTEYSDPFNRPTKSIKAKGVSGLENHTIMHYAPQTVHGIALKNNDVMTTTDLNSIGDALLRSWSVTDGFGRTTENWRKDPQGDIKATTIYDEFGRVKQKSNPYRANESPNYTSISYDLLGRVVHVETPDGAHVFTQHVGNQVTVTDQAGKTRRSESDALGRLIKITEDPGGINYVTKYSYDALGNLRQVVPVMQETQQRTFVYDSLSRLTLATNPESGTIAYSYDPNGNLLEKTDARGVKTKLTYDELNRVKKKEYLGTTTEQIAVANVTPIVNYYYDGYSILPAGAPALSGGGAKGKLVGVTYGGGADGTYFKYDQIGRIITNHQRISSQDYPTSYEYNIGGNVLYELRKTRRISMEYDDIGRLTTMFSSTYPYTQTHRLVSQIKYTGFGAIESEKYDNGLIHTIDYNSRQQLTKVRLGHPDVSLESIFKLDYFYGTVNNTNIQDYDITQIENNGNIARIKYYINGTPQHFQTFQYDQINRLKYAVEHSNGNYSDSARAWFQTFDYDRFGNRGINIANTSDNADVGNSALQLADFSEANNRITREGFAYDAAGNLIAEPGKSYTYDAENRIVKASVNGVISEYIYDGNGRRVKKIIVGGITTRFVYGAGGELQAEYNDSNGVGIKEYIYRSGELLVTRELLKNYVYATSDHLGSPRLWTDWNGNVIANGRHDYLPFGEEIFAGTGSRMTTQGYAASAQADKQRKQFTSKERDVETGLDYFGARYYSSMQGRFVSADEPFADQHVNDPQSWNLYTYTRNNPLMYIDPDGRGIWSWFKDQIQTFHNTIFAGLKMTNQEIRDEAIKAREQIKTGVRWRDGEGKLHEIDTSKMNDWAVVLFRNNIFDQAKNNEIPTVESFDLSGISGTERTDHGEDRKKQADAGDTNRQVGDANRTIRDGRRYQDTDTGNNVYVRGDKVVITDQAGRIITQFKNTRANTQKRVESGKWEPVD